MQQRRRGGRRRRRDEEEPWLPTVDTQDLSPFHRRGAALSRRARESTARRSSGNSSPSGAAAADPPPVSASAASASAPAAHVRPLSLGRQDAFVARRSYSAALPAAGLESMYRLLLGSSIPNRLLGRSARGASASMAHGGLMLRGNHDFGPEDYERLLALDSGVAREAGLPPHLMDQLPVFPFIDPQHTKANNVGVSAAAAAGASSAGPADSANGEPDCSVCLGDFEHHDVVCALPCCHKYHHVCITPWLKSNTSCPNCKRDVAEMLRSSMPPPPSAAAAAAASRSAMGYSQQPASSAAPVVSTSSQQGAVRALGESWLPGMPQSVPAAHRRPPAPERAPPADIVIDLLGDDSDSDGAGVSARVQRGGVAGRRPSASAAGDDFDCLDSSEELEAVGLQPAGTRDCSSSNKRRRA